MLPSRRASKRFAGMSPTPVPRRHVLQAWASLLSPDPTCSQADDARTVGKKNRPASLPGGFLGGREGGRLLPPAWAVLPAPELLHGAGDVGQHAVDLGADRAHRGDRGDGDQRGDQRVLDGGGALLVLHQTTENGQHGNPLKNNGGRLPENEVGRLPGRSCVSPMC